MRSLDFLERLDRMISEQVERSRQNEQGERMAATQSCFMLKEVRAIYEATHIEEYSHFHEKQTQL